MGDGEASDAGMKTVDPYGPTVFLLRRPSAAGTASSVRVGEVGRGALSVKPITAQLMSTPDAP